MKKTYIAVVVAVIAVAAISYVIITDATTLVAPLFTIFAVIPDSIATTNNAFTIDFYRQISSDLGDDSNIFFSPAGMYMAFSILYEGAKQNTAEEI